ncbi:SERTA domain-containing protein 3 [Stygiomarasmius scandens]|uniref:SERTA domain-containing protein 3 n=1 Tax=Marasmiellus scandens TaxID=2682957 RepID=A0ABR1JES2_9AGAR
MAQTNPKRQKSELEVGVDLFPKVRLVTQPEFGHELRHAQQSIAELRGQVVHWEWTEQIARNRATKFEEELARLKDERDELVEELKKMQESESDEVERLGTENVALSRRVSQNDIELQTLRSLVQTLGLLEVANGISESIPARSTDLNKDGISASLSQNKEDDSTHEESDDEDPCERESSVLRNIETEPTRVHRVLYPPDALSSSEARKWFPPAFAYVDIDLGPQYRDFLIKWVEFERFHQWEKAGGRLDKTERPKEITVWITEGRYLPRCKGPNIGTDFIQTFPDDMRKWWRLLRPPALHQEVENWAGLSKHGINSWFSLVAGMKWWGEGLKRLNGDSLRNGTEEWLAMIRELTESLDMLKHSRVANA